MRVSMLSMFPDSVGEALPPSFYLKELQLCSGD